MEQQDRSVDRLIARIASRAHGVVTRKTLLGNGMTPQQVRRRLQRGSLIVVHRGVYRVGHQAPSPEARYLAAALACGDGAVLSGRPAGFLWGLLKGPPPPPVVLCPTERRIRGVHTRRVRPGGSGHAAGREQVLSPPEATKYRGIPVTTVPRTLVDLARTLSEPELARACHEAEVRFETTPDQVERVLARLPNAPGARTLRRILHGDVRVTLSRLERGFLALLRRERLPLPETNRPAGGRRVDCRWPEQRLTVELDSYRYHRSRHAWEADRRREREAYARGDEFRRYTWSDVFEDTHMMLRELRALLRSSPD